jgi:hypothetical protein
MYLPALYDSFLEINTIVLESIPEMPDTHLDYFKELIFGMIKVLTLFDNGDHPFHEHRDLTHERLDKTLDELIKKDYLK